MLTPKALADRTVWVSGCRSVGLWCLPLHREVLSSPLGLHFTPPDKGGGPRHDSLGWASSAWPSLPAGQLSPKTQICEGGLGPM